MARFYCIYSTNGNFDVLLILYRSWASVVIPRIPSADRESLLKIFIKYNQNIEFCRELPGSRMMGMDSDQPRSMISPALFSFKPIVPFLNRVVQREHIFKWRFFEQVVVAGPGYIAAPRRHDGKGS